MLKNGILNPHVLELLGGIRHTDTSVVSGWTCPEGPQIEAIGLIQTADGSPGGCFALESA